MILRTRAKIKSGFLPAPHLNFSLLGRKHTTKLQKDLRLTAGIFRDGFFCKDGKVKTLITLLFLFLPFIAYPQADLMIDFLMYDNATPPYNGSHLLTFGLDSTATDNIDEHLGEAPVPPDICCGLGGPILCALFVLPVNPDPVFIDYRFGELPYTSVKEHLIQYCSDPSSTVVTIQCDLPPGVSALLQDIITGTFIHIEMIDSNEYHIPNMYIGWPLKLTVTYNIPLPVELTSFRAIISEQNVHLNWATATETNNSGFEIQRTSPFPSPYQGEGGEAGRGWEKIGF
ncbi:MAG: hypothetical protein ACHQLA_07275, partial [Ignavibacteriales bacterium]